MQICICFALSICLIFLRNDDSFEVEKYLYVSGRVLLSLAATCLLDLGVKVEYQSFIRACLLLLILTCGDVAGGAGDDSDMVGSECPSSAETWGLSCR